MDGNITRNLFDDGWVLRDISGPLQSNVVP